jgi:hypothetical protein
MLGKKLDNFWGSAGIPLLPHSLRVAWGGERLPQWVTDELGLAEGSTMEVLDDRIWTHGVNILSDRIRNFLLNRLSDRMLELKHLQVFQQPWPYWMQPNDLQLSTRTRNCLNFSGLLSDTEQLSKVTFGKLFETRGMGAVSIIEFACVAEATLGRAKRLPDEVSYDDEICNLISESWADQVGPADPRFSDLIPPVPYATVFEILDRVTSDPGGNIEILDKLAGALPQIRERISAIRSLPLETQLRDFLSAVSRLEGERLSALLDRLGWGGSPPITLEEAGSRLGVTRERLRQLQEKVTNRLKDIPSPVFMPGLDAGLELLRRTSPLSVTAASELLKTHRLSTIPFHPSSLLAAAEACGRKPPICLQTVRKRSIVTTTDIPNADAVMRLAYKQAQASGASNLAELVAELHASGISTDERVALHVLQHFSELELLDDQWFCHRPRNPERDRLRNVTRKMLSVAAPIDLSVLREGARREYRYRSHRSRHGVASRSLIVPPRSVLREYYGGHPEFVINSGDLVNPIDPLDYRTELALNDAIMVDALRSSPACVLDRASFWNECARRSMNINTFNLYLTYSPVIVHLGTDVWSLRGVRVDPAAVEAVRVANALRQKERRVLDHGWTPDGELWVATRLPARQPASFVFGVPGAIKRYLAGRQFIAKDEDEIAYGTIRVNHEGTSSGFGRFLRQRGADEGDILIAEFDLGGDVALLRLGNDELLEEMSPET